MPDTSSLSIEKERLLLGKLSAAPDRKLSVAKLAPKKLTRAYQAAGIADQEAAAAAVDDLAARGLATRETKGRSEWVTMTEAGAARLASMPPPPVPPAKASGKPRPPEPPPDEPENANLAPHQRAFLLMQLLSADGRTLTEGKANGALRTRVARQDLELTPSMAAQLRRKMAGQGYLRAEKQGRSLHLTLTDAGLAYLATLRHHPAAAFPVTGTAINDLVDAARVAPVPQAASGETAAPPPADLREAAYATFRELVRERFSRNGLVPIFSLRREMARKFGPAAARHDALDVPILQLRRDRKIRLISISDTRSASADELEDSITNEYETLFYVEDADGHAHTR